MPFQINATVDCYLLPQDGEQARTTFLGHLADPHEMYIIAYAFTLAPMIDQLVADAPDPRLHIYLDHSQASGKTEAPLIQRLVNAGIEVTIGTSTAGTKFICHTKGIVCNDVPNAWCWEGSVNFSESGWSQVNTAMVFNSQTYYDAFVNQFLNLRYFAWTQERNMQVMSAPPPGALTQPPPMGNDPASTVLSDIGTPSAAQTPAPQDAPTARTTRKRPIGNATQKRAATSAATSKTRTRKSSAARKSGKRSKGR